ncbi:MAG: ABC transporter ATP-binding protein [Chlorobiales bacterium]
MSDIAIKVENVSKLYHIGAKRSGSLRETLAHSFNKLIGKKDAIDKAEEFWALKDVNFEIKKGDAVGIIGKNGAGKSTLLKILSRITEPTTGKITINGRVASLLEVGTGFHQELTGRENIFMNGAILGMKQAEIKRKFDEIVDFSGIEKFIDTPVKHYSSGMYVRLAFAVAAHLEPEILIIDEVLAVGDTEFQKKCLGKMEDVAKNQGRTILFVSHNMTLVSSLCKTGILLSNGRLVYLGDASHAIEQYGLINQAGSTDYTPYQSDKIIQSARIVEIQEVSSSHSPGYIITIELEINTSEPLIGFDIFLKHFGSIFAFASSAYFSEEKIGRHTNKVTCSLGPINLALGTYTIDINTSVPGIKWIEHYNNILDFEVNKQLGSTTGFALDAHRQIGYVILPQVWTTHSEKVQLSELKQI